MGVTKLRYLWAMFVILLVGVSCGDPSAIDRAEADKIVKEAEAAIEMTRVAQAHEIEMEKVQAEKDLIEWEANYKRNLVRKDILLAMVTLVTCFCIGVLGVILGGS